MSVGIMSVGHYPKINPDGANSTPTRSCFLLKVISAKKEIVLQANRTFKFQVLRSNPLLADFKLQRVCYVK